MTKAAMDPIPPPVRPRRTITGMSAVLVPYTADGNIDWAAFEAHVARTAEVGLTPAVNMDTGYVQLLDARHASPGRSTSPPTSPAAAFVAGAFVADEPGDAFDLDAYVAAAIDAIAAPGRHAGDLPVLRAQRACRRRVGRRARRAIGRRRRPLHRLRARRRCSCPYGRIYSLDAYAALLGIARVHRREALVAAAAARSGSGSPSATRCGPTSTCSPATTSPSTWSMYGSDYLLGLSTSRPTCSPRRDRRWATATPRSTSSTTCCSTSATSRSARRCPRTATTRRMFLELRGWAATRRDAARRAPTARQRPGGPGRHRAAARTWLP